MSNTETMLADTIRLQDADAFYERMINAVQNMSEQQALKTMVKLTLILANQVGDDRVLHAALDAAVGSETAD